MNTWFRPFGIGILLPAFFVVLTSCDNDSGSGSPVRLFFGHNNIRECEPITVDVDLLTANAVLARQDDGSLDCALDRSLEVGGCNATFDTVDGGDTLRVVIGGCEVPAIASLFECGFSKGNVSALSSGTSASCDCVGEPVCYWNIYCDRRPNICVAQEANPSGCEDCFNDRDDNGDGFVDCRDRNCNIEDCGYGQTTVTCPNSTSTTITTSTTIP